MGEYAEQYTLQHFGVDIAELDQKKKAKWKWACPVCGKNMSSHKAQSQHVAMKHGAQPKEK